MPQIRWEGLADRLNADPELALAARAWTATVRLDLGEAESRLLRFDDGTVRSVERCDAGAAADVFLSAPPEDWDELLADMPRPFYQDLFGAQMHHGVRLNEDPLDYAAYYPALCRIVAVLRASKEG